jgi:uncharacterized protein (TIGR03435 family)
MWKMACVRSALRSGLFLVTAVSAVLWFGCPRLAIAQNTKTLIGQWQGSTVEAAPRRVLLKIEPSTGSSITGVVYLLDGDNSGWPHATTTFTVRGSDVSFRIANIDADYTGKLGPDSGSLAGMWKQHGVEAPLRLALVTGDVAWEIPPSEKAMAATANPAFEFATIKPADPTETSSGFQLHGERIRAHNDTMESIVRFAYGLHRRQILSAPDWFTTERWEIDGIADIPGNPNLEQMRGMFRKILADRFALKLDPEKRQIPVYAIQVGKDAPTITRSRSDSVLSDSTGNGNNGIHDVRFTNITMDEFAVEMSTFMDRPVVNQSGLSGRFDFRLRWFSGDVAPAENLDLPPALFTAMQEQLGLKVQATRAEMDVYVVAHVDHPSPN